MIKETIKDIILKLQSSDLEKKQKIYLSISIGWILLIGYLTWWNGIKSIGLDKSFKWDEWFWFGIVPATAPYVFYFIWRDKKTD
ncbi:MAG: hypothetical protein ACJZ4E_02065 [Candidatus Pelagibacter sp.]|tara:strand:+ start:391 stop:642 length:252 start_codon:yes stop_codon:yes gene_type:complete